MSWWLNYLGKLVTTAPASESRWEWQERAARYAIWRAYYDNTVYATPQNGGYREYINADLGNARAADLYGAYNPVSNTVDLYQHVFAGSFGEDITIADAPALKEPLERVWKWSNLNIEKKLICENAALFGCVGLRIVVRDHDDPRKKRVYIKA